MYTEVVIIRCCNYSVFFLHHLIAFGEILKSFGCEVERRRYGGITIDLTIDARSVRIIVSQGPMNHCDVCIVGWWIDFANFIAGVKQQVSKCKQQYPEAPIIVVGDASLKNSPPRLKDVELAGRKVFNRKMGGELVRDIDGAVKYVEYSWKSSRGLKTVIDEIVFAYFSKLKDNEDLEKERKEADGVRQERTKQNLFMFEKFLNVLHYI